MAAPRIVAHCWTVATNDPYYRARAKLSAAVIVLATGEGDVRWRLHGAYLHLVGAMTSDLPAEIRKRLLRLQQRLTSKKPKHPGVGRLSATLYRMRLKTGVALAKEIVSIEFDLRIRGRGSEEDARNA